MVVVMGVGTDIGGVVEDPWPDISHQTFFRITEQRQPLGGW